MELYIIIATGILGLIVGSFLNVVALRMNTGRGIGGRSQCLSCGTQLHWYDLVPVVSYFILRGKCRACKTRIGIHYVLGEVVTGLLFAGVAWKINVLMAPVTFILWLVAVSAGMVIAHYDMRHQVIPRYPLLILLGTSIALGLHVIGFVLIPLPFLLMWAISSGKWIGFGDVELMACMGMLLGVTGGISAVVLAFWSACIIMIPWYLVARARNREVSHRVAFGPFLLLGAYAVGILGVSVLNLVAFVIH